MYYSIDIFRHSLLFSFFTEFAKANFSGNYLPLAKIFGVNSPAISKHIQNIYKEKELVRKSTSSKMELVQNESGRKAKRQVDVYNLDVLIAVDYRINNVKFCQNNPPALTVLTILVAESNPKEKERIIKLIVAMLR